MCAAITRWVQYDPTTNGTIGDGNGAGGKGTRGYVAGGDSVGDTFTIGSANKLYVNIDGDGATAITLYSGTNLDPRFIARDITEKLRALGKNDAAWDQAHCKWINTSQDGNVFKLYSGSLGTQSTIDVTAGTDSVHTTLGFSTKVQVGGTSSSNLFNGSLVVGGTYRGMLPETYKVVITNDNDSARGIGTPSKSGGNTYDGVLSTGGVFNDTQDILYVITIDVTNGTTMGGGTGNVPTMSWTSESKDTAQTVATELLYPNHWYNVGTKGLMVKFTDAVFSNGSWNIQCYKPDYSHGTSVSGPPGTAYFAYSSDRGDMGGAAVTPASGTTTALGTRGVTIGFTTSSGTDYLGIRDEFYVICNGPKPTNYNVMGVSFGNVTVSTESATRCVTFEIESGAYQMASVKFGLQSHGSFSHHNAGNNDTYFRFGTVGPGNKAGSAPTNGIEWYQNIVAADIDNDVPPSYLYDTRANLPVVSTADDSEAVGNLGLVSDPIWFNIKLGSSETGASTCNYRTFFDYS